jgi:hypothetical protein
MRSRQHNGGYATAAVCVKGHVATADAETHRASVSKFCSKCGAEVIIACPNCSAPIRGYYIPPGVSGVGGVFKSLANFCYECGKPYPWTIERLKAAKELADDLDEISDGGLRRQPSAEEREKLKAAIEDIASGGPRAEVGAARLKKMLGKAGTVVGQALWKISVEVASEAAKKILLG